MQFIGGPMTVQNTDAGLWLVAMPNAVTGTAGESISLTVALRSDPMAPLPVIQRRALQAAIALLQEMADGLPPG